MQTRERMMPAWSVFLYTHRSVLKRIDSTSLLPYNGRQRNVGAWTDLLELYLYATGAIVAIISMFYGIIVSMYFFDSRRHRRPHIHVKYQDQEVVLSIPEGDVLEGDLKGSKMKLVQAWIVIHQDELMANWELASEGQAVFRIDPLK